MQLDKQQKEYFMREALYEAKKAAVIGEVPIGCVIVSKGQIIGRGHNLREHSHDATMHAEMLALQEANAALKSWRLPDTELFVTLEPCPMCSGAIINARIKKVYFGAMDPKAGTAGSLMNLLEDSRFNHQAVVEQGLLVEECAAILKKFFKQVRRKRKKSRHRD
ncbi:tRNA adenosine(34) deaminase TadA [Liquorilactobacillus oeni]|uniref:tRNA-specific adenosine deaminase n=1 Tax=Liquorilactobacillus oeni DSM 19972 TaxID=1423777 RepID=A0A0R1MHU5_9LACO|nr:tRNA adenosine(34) deaminase TadA [Liquorilactobacillus oeni]KRL04869.1 cytosine adenosine deaminase [Liquorilactobacillus oeni DSM 19972]